MIAHNGSSISLQRTECGVEGRRDRRADRIAVVAQVSPRKRHVIGGPAELGAGIEKLAHDLKQVGKTVMAAALLATNELSSDRIADIVRGQTHKAHTVANRAVPFPVDLRPLEEISTPLDYAGRRLTTTIPEIYGPTQLQHLGEATSIKGATDFLASEILRVASRFEVVADDNTRLYNLSGPITREHRAPGRTQFTLSLGSNTIPGQSESLTALRLTLAGHPSSGTRPEILANSFVTTDGGSDSSLETTISSELFIPKSNEASSTDWAKETPPISYGLRLAATVLLGYDSPADH